MFDDVSRQIQMISDIKMSVAATRFGHTDGKVGLVYGKNGEKVRKKNSYRV